MRVEIERKFLLSGMPTIPRGAEVWEIDQGYGPPEVGRLRRITLAGGTVKFVQTHKTGSGVVREEIERELNREEFDRLWPSTEGKRLRKTRHRVAEGDAVWEIDEYPEFGLALAEIELPAADSPFAFPKWLVDFIVREVTDDPKFTNAAIAARGG